MFRIPPNFHLFTVFLTTPSVRCKTTFFVKTIIQHSFIGFIDTGGMLMCSFYFELNFTAHKDKSS